jgi:hypothetical protein
MTGQPGQGSQDKAAKDWTARETKDYSFFVEIEFSKIHLFSVSSVKQILKEKNLQRLIRGGHLLIFS